MYTIFFIYLYIYLLCFSCLKIKFLDLHKINLKYYLITWFGLQSSLFLIDTRREKVKSFEQSKEMR